MENKAHALAAGLFTLLLGAGVVLAAMWFSGETYERAYYQLESKFAVTGLNEQAVTGRPNARAARARIRKRGRTAGCRMIFLLG